MPFQGCLDAFSRFPYTVFHRKEQVRSQQILKKGINPNPFLEKASFRGSYPVYSFFLQEGDVRMGIWKDMDTWLSSGLEKEESGDI